MRITAFSCVHLLFTQQEEERSVVLTMLLNDVLIALFIIVAQPSLSCYIQLFIVCTEV